MACKNCKLNFKRGYKSCAACGEPNPDYKEPKSEPRRAAPTDDGSVPWCAPDEGPKKPVTVERGPAKPPGPKMPIPTSAHFKESHTQFPPDKGDK